MKTNANKLRKSYQAGKNDAKDFSMLTASSVFLAFRRTSPSPHASHAPCSDVPKLSKPLEVDLHFIHLMDWTDLLEDSSESEVIEICLLTDLRMRRGLQ